VSRLILLTFLVLIGIVALLT